MGSYASSYRDDGTTTVSRSSSPNSPDWITMHATATGLAIVEVERLWSRFQQLGCNEEGVLTADMFQRPPISNDIFMKNILVTMRKDTGMVHFQTFLNAMKWVETSSPEDKVRGVFHFFNNGEPLTQDVLIKVLRRVYPDQEEQEIKTLSGILLEEVATGNEDSIDEEQFMHWVMALPYEALTSVLSFNIVPQDINREAHRTFSKATWGRSNPPSRSSNFTKQIPSDVILREITEKIYRRDWQYLGNKLGFTASSLDEVDAEYASTKDKVMGLLRRWRDREGTRAYAEKLEQALRESNMNDAAMLLYP